MQDISLHLLDIIENSVRAKATLIRIEIKKEMMRNELSFVISDNGIGMNEKILCEAQNPFYTSKVERKKKIGLGIPLFKQNAEMCNGYFNLESKLGVGSTLTAVFQYDHIDRIPMGNLQDTFVGSIIGHADIDFEIILENKLSTGENEVFEFFTVAVKDELDGIPITYPEVISYINDVIKEGIINIKMEEF